MDEEFHNVLSEISLVDLINILSKYIVCSAECDDLFHRWLI